MFELVCENVAKAAEASLQMHQEAFKRWVALWPGVPETAGPSVEQAQRFEATWTEFCEDVLKKQWETLAVQFEAGLQHMEDASRLASGTIDLWWKFFETLHLAPIPAATTRVGETPALQALEESALKRAKQGLPPPRQVYDAENRNRIDWSRFPAWVRPSDPELFEGGHEG
jgi:hypothetical protein